MVYSAILTQVDIENDQNSYYKIQLLEADFDQSIKTKYWVFHSWGGIGTNIGDHTLKPCESLEEAQREFEDVFEQKTGNKFSLSAFVNKPGKYFLVDIEVNIKTKIIDLHKRIMANSNESKLDSSVKKLMELISFDVDNMKDVTLEMKFDTEKSPLGPLSIKSFDKGKRMLDEISKLIDDKKSQQELIAASNQFYSIIPRNFGVKRPLVIDSVEMITEEYEKLANLRQMNVTYEIMNGNKNQFDALYDYLKVDIVSLDKSSSEYELLLKYFENTKGDKKMTVEDIFKVTRNEENERIEKFKEIPNHQLLWHGSAVENYLGILAKGLKIAPAKTSGNLGRGLYFGDTSKLGAAYCWPFDNVGLITLSEVALGNSRDLTKFLSKKEQQLGVLQDGQHSVKGDGITIPNPNETINKDGVIIPLGKLIKRENFDSVFYYNEFVVYNEDQVNIKYVLKLNIID